MNDLNPTRLTTIRLSGQLGKKFGRVHRFYVSSAAEAVRAMCSQLEGFAAYLGDENNKTLYKVFVSDAQIDPEQDLHVQTGYKEIRIAPMVQGAKRGLFQVVLGVALIALSFVPGIGTLTMPFGLAGTVGSAVLMPFGVSLVLGGVASLLSPQPKLNLADAPENTPNANFNGPVNTVSSGRPVPIAYGRVIAGSATVSAGIYSSDMNG